MSGMTTRKNTVEGEAPRLSPARIKVRSKDESVAVTVITTKGVANAVWASTRPASVPSRLSLA